MEKVGEPDYIFVKTGYEEEKVLLEEIHYREAERNCRTYLLNNRKLLLSQSISDALGQLPADKFDRIHRSYLISMSKIEKFSRNSIWIFGKEIPVGSSY